MIKWMHKHKWAIKKAVFQIGNKIESEASNGLTHTVQYIWNATNHSVAPMTVIQTHFAYDRQCVYLYCKVCSVCGKTIKCDAFDAHEYELMNKDFEKALSELTGYNED